MYGNPSILRTYHCFLQLEIGYAYFTDFAIFEARNPDRLNFSKTLSGIFFIAKKRPPKAVLKVVFELQLHQSFKLCHNGVFSGQTQAHIGNLPILKIYESGNV